MNRRVLSIRAILLLIFGVMTLLVALQAGQSAYNQWRHKQRIEALRDASRLSDRIFAATETLSFERDIAATLLRATEAGTIEDLEKRLAESRQETDETMNTALWALDHYAFPELVPLQERITARMANIKRLRGAIDQALTRPFAQRDGTLVTQWYDEASAVIVQTQDLWIEFVGHFTDISPVVTQHLRYKHFLRFITSYTGRERAIIGRLLVENADPTPEEFAELLAGQGGIDLSWKVARLLADQSGLYPAVASSFSDAQSHYQILNSMVRNIFYLPEGHRRGAYPISVDLWLELSTQVAESLDALKAVSVDATQAYIDKLDNQAGRAIMLQLLFLFVALAFCALGFRAITRRVLYPIDRIVEALLATMRGEPAHALFTTRQSDEIGKLVQVLRAFQQNLEIIQKTSGELQRSETAFRAVVDHAIDGLIGIDQRGIIESFNPACERIFGYSAQEVIGRNIKILMPEPYHSEHDNYLSRYMATGQARIIGTAGREVSAKRKDGTVFPMDLSISAFELEDGRHFSGIIRDITVRKQAEQSLKAYNYALELSNKELDDFAYIASHDLKEPLRGIHNHSRFLLEDNQDKLDEESIRKLSRLIYLSQRMERLVNDLLYFSRLGRQDLAVQAIDLNAAIHDIENTLDIFLNDHHARITTPVPLPTITCDKTRVTELFRNLITNAVKYNDSKEKIVEIGFLPQQGAPAGGAYRDVFYVKDNGRGIAPEFHEAIFRIFKRLQTASESADAGTGVGLTFVKKIVERHGGKIWLESQPGQGTVFYFTLKEDNYDTAKAA